MKLPAHRKYPTRIICLFLLGMGVVRGAEVTLGQKGLSTNAATVAAVPAAQVNSLAMLMQVVKQLDHYVKTKDLSSIHNEDMILSAALTGLLTKPDFVVPNRVEQFKADLTGFGQCVSALHLAADLSQQARSEAELRKVFESFERVKAYFPERVMAEARKSLDRCCCPMHRDVVGNRTDFCPKCGMELDQMIRILPFDSGFPNGSQQRVRASVRTAAPLTVGQPAAAYLQLGKANGEPVQLADLIETHTKKIHLLIIDTSLMDYHHEHPQPTRNPGEYSFSFTPRKPGSYRVWADLRPYPLGLQEYVMTDISASTTGERLTDRTISFKTTVDGLNYDLLFEQKEIKSGRPAFAKLRITTADGAGFTRLEPIMATFAHLVGFNEDYKTVLHMHPKGPPVLDSTARGGPELEFQIYALRPGFVRLFAQVQIGGISKFAPFGIQIVR
jgi:hypothetical protein